MREVQPGVWHWTARHPEWEPEADWDETKVDVSSYAIDDGERLLLFDPLAVPSQLLELAAERETAIVLTSPWHRRDAVALSEQLGATIYVPPPDPPDPDPVPGQIYRAGDRLPIGAEAFPGREEPNDLVLWVESHRALVTGDTLVDRGRGLEFLPEWAPDGVKPDDILEGLQPLRDLPVELVLPTHGSPTDRAAWSARSMPEARLEDSGSGLVPTGEGWFVVNARDAEWWVSKTFGSGTVFESEAAEFTQLGINIAVLEPGEPNCLYHAENQQEAFLVLSGECRLLVMEEERLLGPWDFFHCPPGTDHVFVGAGDGPSVILMTGARTKDEQFLYPKSELAARYGASSDETTPDPKQAYAPFERAARARPSYWDRLPWA